MANMLDYIRSIVDKSIIELDNNYSQFALNNYFSKYKNCIFFINELLGKTLTNKQHYDYLMCVIPRGWQKKLEYPKLKEEKENDIDILVKHFNIHKDVAKDYLMIIDENELKEIRREYNV